MSLPRPPNSNSANSLDQLLERIWSVHCIPVVQPSLPSGAISDSWSLETRSRPLLQPTNEPATELGKE